MLESWLKSTGVLSYSSRVETMSNLHVLYPVPVLSVVLLVIPYSSKGIFNFPQEVFFTECILRDVLVFIILEMCHVTFITFFVVLIRPFLFHSIPFLSFSSRWI